MNTLDYPPFVRTKPCLICGGKSEAAHLRPIATKRARPSLRHLTCVPLCHGHHQEQEGRTAQFNEAHNIDLWKEAFVLYIEYSLGREACLNNDRWGS